MALDGDTIIAILAMLALSTGIMLFFAGWRSGAAATAFLWGMANIYIAIGVFLILQHESIELAFGCIIIAIALMWASMAAFNRRTVPPIFLIGGVLVWSLVSFAPIVDWSFGPSAAAYLAVGFVYIVGCARELWRMRSLGLPAQRFLFILVVIDCLAVGYGAVAIFPRDSIAQQQITTGAVWPVYLAATLFTAASSALVIALIKERIAAEHLTAAETDSLTGLANRRTVLAAGASRLEMARRQGHDFAAAIFDLDRFKAINDTYGHHTGDIALQRFAHSLSTGARPSDFVGRLGGEEFIALIPGAGPEAAIAIVDRIRRAFRQAAQWIDGKPVYATVSVGVAVLRSEDGALALDALLGHADRALYEAKANGRDRVTFRDIEDDPPAGEVVRIA